MQDLQARNKDRPRASPWTSPPFLLGSVGVCSTDRAAREAACASSSDDAQSLSPSSPTRRRAHPMNASSRPPLTPFFTAGTRTPALVTLPGRDAPRGARLVRLRVRDRPGSLAAVTGHLAEFGVDVIRVEVLNREAGWAIDDLLLTGRRLDDA